VQGKLKTVCGPGCAARAQGIASRQNSVNTDNDDLQKFVKRARQQRLRKQQSAPTSVVVTNVQNDTSH
jgi:hypothetical protein